MHSTADTEDESMTVETETYSEANTFSMLVLSAVHLYIGECWRRERLRAAANGRALLHDRRLRKKHIKARQHTLRAVPQVGRRA